VFHLRAVHDYDGEHPVNDYKREFGLRFAASGRTRAKMSGAKESFWAKRGQHWTREKLLEALRRMHRAGRSLRPAVVETKIYEAARRLFGTWLAAVEKAGLDYDDATGVRHWTRKKVLEEIQELAARGEPLSGSYTLEHHPQLHNAALNRFGRSWSKALRAAGLDPAAHRMSRRIWDRESAAQWVRKRAGKAKLLLASSAPPDLVRFVHRYLGGWADFIESLGIPYPGIKKRRDWTKRKLVEEMRRWHAEGHRLNYKSVQSEYQALIHQARKYFGSWDCARAAAGV
jgi:hypothetical protein